MSATVLIVDDIEQNIKILEAKLLHEYYNVIRANDGFEAIKKLENNNVDIILLDVMMPHMDGFETCKRIKSNSKTTYIPIVMITALSDVEDRIKGLESGADEFLTKPINDIALFARVKSLIRMKIVIDELRMRNKIISEIVGTILLTDDQIDFMENKILLIDEDLVQARNIKTGLSSLSYDIKLIASSSEISNLGDFVPDIILISCQLEEEDPLRISVMLRSMEKTKHAILIMLAADENELMVIRGMELGVNDYCIYPIDNSELHARIKTQIRRKKYQDQLHKELSDTVNLSIKDGLTGLFNRRYFDIHINRMIEKLDNKGSLCLAMIDVDYFKEINDVYGHQAGDEILIQLANIFKSSLRVTDLIARYGGEEFVILLCNTTIKCATNVVEKIRKKVEKAVFDLAFYQIKLKKTISIGICQYKYNENLSEFINRTDKALYKAKYTGRNKIIVG